MTDFKRYRRKGLTEMRPYVPGEDLADISVGDIKPCESGWIARNPNDHKDQWYVSPEFFTSMEFEEVGRVIDTQGQ